MVAKTLPDPVGVAGRFAELPGGSTRDSERFARQRPRGQEEFRGGDFRDNKLVRRETPPDPFPGLPQSSELFREIWPPAS